MALGSLKGFLNKGQPRQSTLYDFSLATRAVIYVYDYSKVGKLPINLGLEQKDILPVQINPSSYNRMKFNSGTETSAPSEKIDWEHLGGRSKENSLEVTLTFDISDEYMAISNNGLIPYDVDIDSATIINKLYEYANPGYLCLFKWGPLNYLSRISSLSCTYEKFSPYGEPLRASVNVNFSKYQSKIFKYSDDDPSEIIGKTNWAAVKAYQTADSAMVFAQKAIDAAANEALPSIIKAARKPSESKE